MLAMREEQINVLTLELEKCIKASDERARK
jgi:hypothetical protein